MKDLWKKILQQAQIMQRKVNITNTHQLMKSSYIDKLIGINVGIYILYKLGIPSTAFYHNNFCVKQSHNYPFNYVLANFFHQGLFHLGMNCFAMKNLMQLSDGLVGRKATLIAFLIGGIFSTYSGSEKLKERYNNNLLIFFKFFLIF